MPRRRRSAASQEQRDSSSESSSTAGSEENKSMAIIDKLTTKYMKRDASRKVQMKNKASGSAEPVPRITRGTASSVSDAESSPKNATSPKTKTSSISKPTRQTRSKTTSPQNVSPSTSEDNPSPAKHTSTRKSNVKDKAPQPVKAEPRRSQRVSITPVHAPEAKEKEPKTTSAKLKQKAVKNKRKPGYEADTETTTDQSDTGSLSQDLYNFDISEDPMDMSDPQSKSKSSQKKKGSPKAVKSQERRDRKSTNLLEPKMSKGPVPAKKVKKEKERPFWETFKPSSGSSKRKVPSLPAGKPKKLRKTDDKLMSHQNILRAGHTIDGLSSVESSMVDSGVFMTPDATMYGDSSLSLGQENRGPTSTPSIVLANKGSYRDIEAQEALMIPAFISPVSYQSPAKRTAPQQDTDMGSPKLKSPLAERTYKNVSFHGVSHQEKKQRRKSKGTFKTERVNEWADQINRDFEEIDQFELSIEG